MSGNLSITFGSVGSTTWFDVILIFGQLVSGFGPVLALLGAIYLYFRKEEASAKRELRIDKRLLYARFLERCNDAWTKMTAFSEKENDTGVYHDAVEKLGSVESELSLVAPAEVADVASRFVSELKEFRKLQDTIEDESFEWGGEDEAQYQTEKDSCIDKLARLELELTDAMRDDLGFYATHSETSN